MGNTLQKGEHESVNIFPNFNISSEMYNREIGYQLDKSNNNIKIKAMLSCQNANAFLSLQEYSLKKHCSKPSKCKFFKKQNESHEGITNKIDICLPSETKLDHSFPST